MRVVLVIILLNITLPLFVSAHDEKFHRSGSEASPNKVVEPPPENGGQVHRISNSWIEVVYKKGQLLIFERSVPYKSVSKRSEINSTIGSELHSKFDLEGEALFFSRPGVKKIPLNRTAFGWSGSLDFGSDPRVTFVLSSKLKADPSKKKDGRLKGETIRMTLESQL